MISPIFEQFYPTKDYQSKSPQERQQFVQRISSSQQNSSIQIERMIIECQYPQKGFIDLQGLQNGKQIKLMTFRYSPKVNKTKGVVALFHTYFVHSGYTAHLAKKLSDHGYTVVAYDLRGHGLSQGQRGQWNDYQAIIKETFDFIKKIQFIYPQLPIYAFGWGSSAINILHISLYQFKQVNFAGLILASGLYKMPVYGKSFQIVKNVVLKILHIFPMKIGIFYRNFDFFTKYKNIRKILDTDKLNTQQQSSQTTALQINDLVQDIPQRLWNKIETAPIVILHGELDKFGNGYNSYLFYKSIKTQDKQLWYYPQMNFGGFLFEQQYQEVSERLIKWLDKQTLKWNEKK